jgi:predicted ester cyclase
MDVNRRQALLLGAALAGAAATSPAAAGGPLERNRRIGQRYFDEVWNQGRLDVLDELLSPDYVNHTPSTGNPPPGPDGLKPIVAAIRRGFPDLRFEVKDMVVTPDAIAIRVVMRGTHLGELFGTAPTGKPVEVNQINIERIRNGRIVEHWRITDELEMQRQLGLVRTTDDRQN